MGLDKYWAGMGWKPDDWSQWGDWRDNTPLVLFHPDQWEPTKEKLANCKNKLKEYNDALSTLEKRIKYYEPQIKSKVNSLADTYVNNYLDSPINEFTDSRGVPRIGNIAISTMKAYHDAQKNKE